MNSLNPVMPIAASNLEVLPLTAEQERHDVMRTLPAQCTAEEAHDAITAYCNSYSRMGTVIRLRQEMVSSEWWRLLGMEWTLSDNIAAHIGALLPLLRDATPENLWAMMSEEARALWRTLPSSLTVYRGCYPNNRKGLSWSLSEEVACRVPQTWRYRQPGRRELLITGTVDKARVSIHLDRAEFEVVSAVVLPMREKRGSHSRAGAVAS